MDRKKVLVAGAGVTGLLTAKLLREELDVEVLVVSEGHPKDSTSAGAGGLWLPFHCEPADLVNKWSEETFDFFKKMQNGGHKSVETVPLYLLKTPEEENHLPEWRNIMNGALNFKISDLGKSDLKSFKGFEEYSKTFSLDTLVIDSPRFLQFMLDEFKKDLKVEVRLNSKKFTSLEDIKSMAVKEKCDVVVNALGLGSGPVLKDAQIKPGRGPLYIYKRPKGVSRNITVEGGSLGSDDKPAYMICRGDIIIIGGSFMVGDWSQEITHEEKTRLERNTRILAPELGNEKPMKTWVGFRPYREGGIRFDDIVIDKKTGLSMVNNYGHGGSGWTVGYGAAKASVDKVKMLLNTRQGKL